MNKEKLEKLRADFVDISEMVDDIYDSLNVNHLNYVGTAKKNIVELKNKIESMKNEYKE